MPALRIHFEDIPVLLKYFIDHFCEQYGKIKMFPTENLIDLDMFPLLSNFEYKTKIDLSKIPLNEIDFDNNNLKSSKINNISKDI